MVHQVTHEVTLRYYSRAGAENIGLWPVRRQSDPAVGRMTVVAEYFCSVPLVLIPSCGEMMIGWHKWMRLRRWLGAGLNALVNYIP